MRNKNKVLEIAIRKLRRFDKKTYCGYLSSSEIMALHKDGWRQYAHKNHPSYEYGEYKIKSTADALKSGISGAQTMYYQVIGNTKPNC